MNVFGGQGKASCTTDSLQLDAGMGVTFSGPSGVAAVAFPFPAHYTVSVDVTFVGTYECPSLGRTAPGAVGGEGGSVVVCDDGGWKTTWMGAQHGASHVALSTSYHLAMTVRGGTETFWINGTQVDAVALTSATTPTTGISLGSYGVSPARFKNFTITPLP